MTYIVTLLMNFGWLQSVVQNGAILECEHFQYSVNIEFQYSVLIFDSYIRSQYLIPILFGQYLIPILGQY